MKQLCFCSNHSEFFSALISSTIGTIPKSHKIRKFRNIVICVFRWKLSNCLVYAYIKICVQNTQNQIKGKSKAIFIFSPYTYIWRFLRTIIPFVSLYLISTLIYYESSVRNCINYLMNSPQPSELEWLNQFHENESKIHIEIRHICS